MQNQITLTIQPSNAVDLKTKQKALEAIALLETDTLTFLGELANSPKAVKKLKDNKRLIKTMVM